MGRETELVRKLAGSVAAGVDGGDVGEVAHPECRRDLTSHVKNSSDFLLVMYMADQAHVIAFKSLVR